ncbi:MAG: hypothetical protein Q4E91_01485 [Lachnospiraceae bacterium]|nr:hypothetical protein [Lachnospiraceae bacterium]
MRLRYGWRGLALAAAFGIAGLCGGCSRAAMNYQLAESIGTVGKYENNEPVETPQMKVEREQRESQEAKEENLQAQLDAAAALAEGYYYEEAAAVLQAITGDDAEDERVAAAISEYQAAQESLTAYEGDIPHLCFPGLIEDTMRAFDGDDMSYTYSSSMVTVKEFRAMLQSLYENNYVLVDIHSIAGNDTDARGVTTVEQKELLLPPGKKPIIISQDNLNYSGIKNGDGIATKLVLDDEGNVKALYTDEGGHDLKGDYDLIPILDAFVEEHPDFSLRGAKGIVSVSAFEGVFGYPVEDSAVLNYEDNRAAVQKIATRLKETGWSIACAGYDRSYMNEMTVDRLKSDIQQWMEEVGTLVGETDILFYPYGAEVAYPSDQLDYLLDSGFVYLCGLWADTDFWELRDGYMRQTRRFIDGYTLENVPQYFTNFFDVSQLLDSDR